MTDELSEIRRRVASLERQHAVDSEKLTSFMRKGEAFRKNELESLDSIKKGVQNLKIDLGAIKLKTLLLIKTLRHTSSKSDLERLSKKLERWDPQSYISRRSFEKMLREI